MDGHIVSALNFVLSLALKNNITVLPECRAAPRKLRKNVHVSSEIVTACLIK
jgi:hypothetical protein